MKANTKNKPIIDPVQHAMSCEIQRQIAEYDRQHAIEFDSMVLWFLHKRYRHRREWLKQFYDDFVPWQEELIRRYEFGKADAPWLCMEELKKIGVDLEQWDKERRSK